MTFPWITRQAIVPTTSHGEVSWFLYLLECKGGAYYAGITNDLEARFTAHKEGRGARYTRANPPLRILATKPYADRSAASIAEAQLKRIPRNEKLDFFSEGTTD